MSPQLNAQMPNDVLAAHRRIAADAIPASFACTASNACGAFVDCIAITAGIPHHRRRCTPRPRRPNTRPRHQPLPTTHQSRATSPVIPASSAGTQRHDQSQRNLSPRPRTHPERTSPAAVVIPSAAQRSRGISPSFHAPSPTKAHRRKLDTSPAKVDTSLETEHIRPKTGHIRPEN